MPTPSYPSDSITETLITQIQNLGGTPTSFGLGELQRLLASLQGGGGGGGGVTSFNTRTGAVTPATGDYTVSEVTGAAPLASPALTGTPTAPTAAGGTNTTQLATTAFVIANAASAGVSSFNTRTGAVTPTSGDYTVSQVTGAAPLASPTLTGTPTTPTAAPGTNTTEIASTAFVAASFAPLASPTLTGTPAAPTAAGSTNTTQIATTAFVHGTYAPLASPALTGVPTAPTATGGTNTTQIATTAFVEAATAGSSGNVWTLFNVIFYGATGNGTSDDTAGINAAVAAAVAAGGGIVYFPSGTYKTTSTITVNSANPVYLTGAGRWATTIKPTFAASDTFRVFLSTIGEGGGILGMTIDGTNATGASSGLHVGDMFQYALDVAVQNFTGTNAIGAWFDNVYMFTEQLHGTVFASNNSNNVLFDEGSGAGTTTHATVTGSFERFDLSIYINQGNSSAYDGLVFRNGAFVSNGTLRYKGNFGAGTSLTSAALRITGAAPTGAADAGNASNVAYNTIDIGLEVTATGTGPYAVFFGSTSNFMTENQGCFNTGANAPTGVFQAPNHPSLVGINGLVSTTLFAPTASWPYPDLAWSPMPHAIGQYITAFSVSGTVTIDPTGAAESSGGYALLPLAPTGNLTGAIMVKGLMDGQVVKILNTSADTITFAASGTSNVADGTSDVIAATSVAEYTYFNATSLWYRTK